MQEQPCAAPLTVTLHNADDHAVSGAAVQLRVGEATTQTATTDQTGQAQLCAAEAGPVRVAVSGKLAGGTPLRQIGQDAQGILFSLSSGEENRLDLRAETDGSVAPDPATMWAREQNGPPVSTAVVVPTSAAQAAPLSTSAPQAQPTQLALILTAPEAPIATAQATIAVSSRPATTAPGLDSHSAVLVAGVLVVLLLVVTLVLMRVRPLRAES